MNYLDIMQDSIDYIEENLKSELYASELAEKAGFSLFHYYRIFQRAIGIPVMQYITRRKLSNAIYEISLGEKIIDVALSYGFNTHAGFFKAFKNEYRCSPTQYIKEHKVIKPYRINLLQEAHIMITDKKLVKILTNWQLEEPIDIKNVYFGSIGTKAENVWNINEDYIMKVGTNIKGLENSIMVSKALSKVGLEAAIPVLTKDNKNYFIDGELYFCLTEKVEGESYKSGDMYKGDYKQKGRYLGEIIGQLHLVLQDIDEEIVCNDENIYETLKNWAIPETKKCMILQSSFQDEYLENFKKLYEHLPKQIIHRDPNLNNIIIREGKLSGFIDFECTERNIRIFDPCYAATSILSEGFGETDSVKLDKWIEIFENIIIGYDSVCKLSKEEKEAIPYVVYAIQIIFVAYCSSIDKLSELSKVNQKMLLWLYDKRHVLSVD